MQIIAHKKQLEFIEKDITSIGEVVFNAYVDNDLKLEKLQKALKLDEINAYWLEQYLYSAFQKYSELKDEFVKDKKDE